jgi:hypothetical protein
LNSTRFISGDAAAHGQNQRLLFHHKTGGRVSGIADVIRTCSVIRMDGVTARYGGSSPNGARTAEERGGASRSRRRGDPKHRANPDNEQRKDIHPDVRRKIDSTAIPLPFVSYTGKRVMWYAGWQKSGNFGFKFNILHSKVQVV